MTPLFSSYPHLFQIYLIVFLTPGLCLSLLLGRFNVGWRFLGNRNSISEFTQPTWSSPIKRIDNKPAVRNRDHFSMSVGFSMSQAQPWTDRLSVDIESQQLMWSAPSESNMWHGVWLVNERWVQRCDCLMTARLLTLDTGHMSGERVRQNLYDRPCL